MGMKTVDAPSHGSPANCNTSARVTGQHPQITNCITSSRQTEGIATNPANAGSGTTAKGKPTPRPV